VPYPIDGGGRRAEEGRDSWQDAKVVTRALPAVTVGDELLGLVLFPSFQ
jgi:hypothetical protein